jgi:phosphoserine phosphatase
MDTVVVLIARPRSAALDNSLLERVVTLIDAAEVRWLAREEACELAVAGAAGIENSLRALIADRPIDVAVLPTVHRRKRLLIADMDSTMIAQECIDELGAAAGQGKKIAAITARAMRGEIDFAASLRERLTLMAGLDQSAIGRLIGETRFTEGGRTLVQTMKSNGAQTMLVSGGFTVFTSHVAKVLGFDGHRANELVIEDGRLTGHALEPILGREAKTAALRELAEKLGLDLIETLAVGDGANDIDMLAASGLGVAFHAKPAVRAQARARIDHGDLTALLYLQGYAKSEFVN